ncbi:MAG: hypothetical protein WDM77_20555 [Steroidobacteraceae bacterium]
MTNQQQHESKMGNARLKGARKSRGSELTHPEEQAEGVTDPGSSIPDPANPSGQQHGRFGNPGDDPERINEHGSRS